MAIFHSNPENYLIVVPTQWRRLALCAVYNYSYHEYENEKKYVTDPREICIFINALSDVSLIFHAHRLNREKNLSCVKNYQIGV